jgi:charged multivesicular body protein 4
MFLLISEVAPTTQEALQKLNETEEVLRKKQDFLEKKVDAELQTAKKHGTSNKRMALQALRRKKQCEKQLQQLDGVLNTLSHQKETLENASINAEVMGVLAHSSSALKNTHNMDIDKVHDLLEDIAEQQEIANEISIGKLKTLNSKQGLCISSRKCKKLLLVFKTKHLCFSVWSFKTLSFPVA